MKAWSRWQGWAILAAGLYGILSPLWFDGERGATGTLLTFGILIVGTAVVALARPAMVWAEWVNAVWGTLMLTAPWAYGTYDDNWDVTLTSAIVGLVTMALSLHAANKGKAAQRS
ncbi:SPW repeat domain-containing protein [Nonomuraea sp. 3N208]|uniref:SPW repeat domain-containing protein n=1 Tax=Nonomuraea sp. 3N208 TaxID=3457421 RepID=UPI003FD35F77